MRPKLAILGVLLFALGALMLAMPSLATQFASDIGIAQSSTHSTDYLISVVPGNVSYVPYQVNPDQTLTGKVAAGPQPVNFFIMDAGNFSAWTARNSAPSQVLPQSSLDVGNYTFTLSGIPSGEYNLVFLSKGTAVTNVLLGLTTETHYSNFVVTYLPISSLLIGAVLLAYGARAGGGAGTAPEGNPEPATRAEHETTCRFCGTPLGDSKFCPSCKRSQA